MNRQRYIWSFLTLLLALVGATAAPAQGVALTPLGIAWRVKGVWLVDGASRPIRAGDAIPPGSLLRPEKLETVHSIVSLLPDGQRVLYECFTEEQCGRGFRVPVLYERPTPFATELLARIRSALARERDQLRPESGLNRSLPRDQTLVVLGEGGEVSIGGLAASLPDGRYSCETIGRAARGAALPNRFTVVKKGPFLRLSLPATGIYDLVVRDDLNRPRIDLFIAAVKPANASGWMKSFRHAQELMRQWNGDYAGWPMDDFQRAYIESLVLNIEPRRGVPEETAAARGPLPETTAEPAFSPEPGVFKGDVMVRLWCDTRGAEIHFTTDTSQPVKESPVYARPISVKATELTIKAYASSPGKKDSAVVTGIFRIER